jgi:transposase
VAKAFISVGNFVARCVVTHGLHHNPPGKRAKYAGLFQADAFDGYRQLYLPNRKPGPILEAACWVHARRPFFAMADLDENARRRAAGKTVITLSPIAIEVVRRIDALFEIERPSTAKALMSAGLFVRR